MIRLALGRLAGRRARCLLVAAVATCSVGLFATPALAAVEWHVTTTHANAYGRMGARDPYALNERTFARESVGNTYTITVQNEGTEDSHPTEAGQPTPTVVKDKLPAGMALAGVPNKNSPLLVPANSWECTIEDQATAFTCTLSTVLKPGESAPLIAAEVAVSAEAAPPADSVTTLTNIATVQGGGGLPAQTTQQEGETTIVPATPFGVDAFAVHTGKFSGLWQAEELEFLETYKIKELEGKFEPFNKAGGHPFSLTTALVLNHAPFVDVSVDAKGNPLPTLSQGIDVSSARDNAKEVEVEVPPGFVANVLSMPRCPIQLLSEACPIDTAVGWSATDLEQESHIGAKEEEIRDRNPLGEKLNKPEVIQREAGDLQLFKNTATEAGRNSLTLVLGSIPDRGFIYNMQPAPGNPAEFGFSISGQPILLEVKLHSDGNYGVTVGDNAAGGRWPATDATFCDNGVEGKSLPEFQSTAVFSCKTPPPGSVSRPLLTNPTECSKPTWTAHANSWVEPLTDSSKEVYVNVKARRVTRATHEVLNEGTAGVLKEDPTTPGSELTGCDQLLFDPEIAFAPSPPERRGPTEPEEGGSNQADVPTGATFELKLPQTPEETESTNATPALRSVVMKLPEGMTASPSAANGLEACSKAQFWPGKAMEEEEAEGKTPKPQLEEGREPAVSAKCPAASQIGTVEVFSPLLSGAPAAEGPTTGKLTCSQGMWTRGTWDASEEEIRKEHLSFSYQWLRSGKDIKEEEINEGGKIETIEGGQTRTYEVGKADSGKALQCLVTASNDGGRSVAVSQPTFSKEFAKPLLYPPANVAPPSGSASAGNSLVCGSGQWTGATSFVYQWLENGEPMGAPSAETPSSENTSPTLGGGDAGKVIQCQVTGKNAGGEAIAISAAVVASPMPAPPPPLPGGGVQGQVFQGQPECSPCTSADAEDGKMLQLFIQARNPLQLDPKDPKAGLFVKLHGVTKANKDTGRLTSEFTEQPQQPFEVFKLKLKGGPRAPLANPQTCGPAETQADLLPWSAAPAEGEPAIDKPEWHKTFSFNVEGCAPTLPFSPSFNAGTVGPTATTAGAPTSFSVTFGRKTGEQDLSGITVHLPPGLVGKIPAVKECGDAEIALAEHNGGECPAASRIGEATSLAGTGTPIVQKGSVYFTGPYEGAPFGLVVITRAEAGPFNLGNVVVRSRIEINPYTAAVTATTPKLPLIVSGVPIRLREVNVNVNKPGFMLNPTNCSAQQVSATFAGETLGGAQHASAPAASPFGITGCTSLPFHPIFTASTQANASKANGASLDVHVTYPPGAYANIAKTATDLPAVLPSRLTTIQKACVDTVFEANPAACPEGSVVGYATAHTPTLNQPLAGPAYLVSHGNAAFPDLEIVLQGEGVKVILDGQTDIKKGVTKTTFNALPDAPVETFEIVLPESPHSALAANGNLCATTLNLPTELTGQNGAVIKQTTHIAVTGCPPTVAITKTQIKGNALLVTVKMSAKGTVKISGKGLKTTTKRGLKAGIHQIRVALTKTGRSLRAHHKKASVHISLTVGKQVAGSATSVRL